MECISQAMLESNQKSTTKGCGDQAKSWDREPESQKGCLDLLIRPLLRERSYIKYNCCVELPVAPPASTASPLSVRSDLLSWGGLDL